MNDFSLVQVQQKEISRPLILAIEDNQDNLLLIDYIAESLNCRFIGETEGSKAIMLAKMHSPNVILLDMMLPDTSGFEIFVNLKQDPITAQIPVIAVTALAMQEDKKKIESLGFNEYVTKPYMLEELEETIRAYLP